MTMYRTACCLPHTHKHADRYPHNCVCECAYLSVTQTSLEKKHSKQKKKKKSALQESKHTHTHMNLDLSTHTQTHMWTEPLKKMHLHTALFMKSVFYRLMFELKAPKNPSCSWLTRKKRWGTHGRVSCNIRCDYQYRWETTGHSIIYSTSS